MANGELIGYIIITHIKECKAPIIMFMIKQNRGPTIFNLKQTKITSFRDLLNQIYPRIKQQYQ